MNSQEQLQSVLQGPLRNYVTNPKNKASLALTSKAFYNQLKNNRNMKAFKEYELVKQAFFLRAFVREFLQLYDDITPNYTPRLLLDLSNRMVNRYYNLPDKKSRLNLLGVRELRNVDSEPRRLLVSFLVNILVKFKKIDKILSNFIADGVKKIRNAKNQNYLFDIIRNDYHFKSNPNAVFKTLTKVHDRSGMRGLTQRKASGNHTMRIVRSMTGGLKPLDYVQTRTFTFSEFSPISQLVSLGKVNETNANQSFITLLAPQVSKKSVKQFLSEIRLKELNGRDVPKIYIQNRYNMLENNEPRWNDALGRVIGRDFIPLENNESVNNTNVNTNMNGNIVKIKNTFKMSRKNINEFIEQEYPNFKKSTNTVPRHSLGPLIESKRAENQKRTQNKGKMPIWFQGNYHSYLQQK